MAARLAAGRVLAAPEEWSRRKLQVLLVVVGIVVVAVVAGIVWSVVALLGSESAADASGDAASPDGGEAATRRDPAEAAQPGPLSNDTVGTIRIPQPSILGPAQVATGFPETAAGALAQLIAIDRRAIESASVVAAQDVIEAWSAPGGPTAQSWSGTAAVATLLESAGLPANGSADLSVGLDPAMGRVEEGVETTTACVDFVLTATVPGGQPDRIAVADCQRMTWRDGRWVIAAGDEPPPMPSVWPGTQASYDAGYRWLEVRP